MINQCDDCQYYSYDEDYDSYACEMSLDEDEYARMMESSKATCPYYKRGDEYSVVRKQFG